MHRGLDTKVLGRNHKCFRQRNKTTNHCINKLNGCPACHARTRDSSWKPIHILFLQAARSPVGNQKAAIHYLPLQMQISATQHCKTSHQSLIFPPSNPLFANYCTAVFLRAMQDANLAGVGGRGVVSERAWERISSRRKKVCSNHLMSY